MSLLGQHRRMTVNQQLRSGQCMVFSVFLIPGVWDTTVPSQDNAEGFDDRTIGCSADLQSAKRIFNTVLFNLSERYASMHAIF